MPERMHYHEIVESVGIEIEFSNLDRKSNKLITNMRTKELANYRLMHDASCESLKEFFADTEYPIEFTKKKDLETLAPIVRRVIIGGEIVSPIRHSGHVDWINEIHSLVNILKENGEDESSERDSFHVHVNVSQSIPLFAVQNLLRITLNLEAILFRLGGMGRINRGHINNYAFCRPFLGNGPPVIKQQWGNNKISNIPICDLKALLNSETKEEFFQRFGDSIYHANHGGKYVTQRYMCVNFYPILTQGSFEFRTANKTLNPDYIIAWTNFCKAVVDKAFTCRDEESYDKVERPFYENREISTDEFLDSLLYYPKLDEDTIDVLVDIWEKSPTPIFDNLWRYSHLREPTRFRNPEFAPKSLGDEIVEKPIFIDIHHLQDNDRNDRGLNLGHGLGRFFIGGQMPRLRQQENIIIRQDGARVNIDEIVINQMDFDFVCRWEAEYLSITFWKNDLNELTIVVYNHEEEEEYQHNFGPVMWFSLQQVINDLFNGQNLSNIRLQ